MVHKKFMDIERLKPTFSDGFNKGDYYNCSTEQKEYLVF